MTTGRSKSSDDTGPLWRISGLGLELVSAILGMLLVGWILDRWLGTAPRWTTLGAVVGVLGGVYNFIRRALSLNRKAVEAYQREHKRPRPISADDPRNLEHGSDD